MDQLQRGWLADARSSAPACICAALVLLIKTLNPNMRRFLLRGSVGFLPNWVKRERGGGVFACVFSCSSLPGRICVGYFFTDVFGNGDHGPAALQGSRPVYDADKPLLGVEELQRVARSEQSLLFSFLGRNLTCCNAAAVESTTCLRPIRWKISKYFHYDRSTTKIKEITEFITTCRINSTVFRDLFLSFSLFVVTHICLLVSASPRNYVQAPYNPLFPFRPIAVPFQLLSFLRVAQVQEMKLPAQLGQTRPL